MKKIIKPGLVSVTLLILSFTACKKTEPLFPHTPPIASAGKDTVLTLPVNSILLDGRASQISGTKPVTYKWELLSGPSTYTIVNPGAAKTMVENLAKGTYVFTLTISDWYGYNIRDDVQITVWDPPYIHTKSVRDTVVSLPYNHAILKSVDGNIYNSISKWEKISGPNFFSIENQNSESTKVSDLVEGVYKFKLITTIYWNQLVRTDTMIVTVLPDDKIYTAEKLFENLVWIDKDPISTITVNNISSFLAAGQQFKVYLKQDFNADWQIVCPELNDPYNIYSYHYSIDNNALKVFINFDPTGLGDSNFGTFLLQPAIKIVY